MAVNALFKPDTLSSGSDSDRTQYLCCVTHASGAIVTLPSRARPKDRGLALLSEVLPIEDSDGRGMPQIRIGPNRTTFWIGLSSYLLSRDGAGAGAGAPCSTSTSEKCG